MDQAEELRNVIKKQNQRTKKPGSSLSQVERAVWENPTLP
mgnify:CR=1 FL=1